MDRDLALKLVDEMEKLRRDLDKMQAYQKTMAEELQQIATNTTPAEEPAETPAEEPAGT